MPVFKINPYFVGRLGSGVLVSASVQYKSPSRGSVRVRSTG